MVRSCGKRLRLLVLHRLCSFLRSKRTRGHHRTNVSGHRKECGEAEDLQSVRIRAATLQSERQSMDPQSPAVEAGPSGAGADSLGREREFYPSPGRVDTTSAREGTKRSPLCK
jgi:hypothetical protein